jgi:hypothetical protein
MPQESSSADLRDWTRERLDLAAKGWLRLLEPPGSLLTNAEHRRAVQVRMLRRIVVELVERLERQEHTLRLWRAEDGTL